MGDAADDAWDAGFNQEMFLWDLRKAIRAAGCECKNPLVEDDDNGLWTCKICGTQTDV